MLPDRFQYNYVASRRPHYADFERLAIANEFAPLLVALDDLYDLRIAGVIEADVLAIGRQQPERRRGCGHGAFHRLCVLGLGSNALIGILGRGLFVLSMRGLTASIY